MIEIENINTCKHGLNTDYVSYSNDIDGTSNCDSEFYNYNDNDKYDNDSTSDYGSMDFCIMKERMVIIIAMDQRALKIIRLKSNQLKKEKLVEIKGALNKFKIHLADSTEGPNKSATETNTIVGRIAKFLIWSYILTHFTPIEIFNTIPFVFEVIFVRFALVGQYVEYLAGSKAMKPSTLLQFLADMILVISSCG
jgi:hypothetical protein